MRVIQIPTNRPVQRIDDVDLVFGNSNARFKALVEEVKKRHATGQPILIGTASVEKSEIVDKLLTEAGLPHDVLNAKNHAREAAIIAEAGKKVLSLSLQIWLVVVPILKLTMKLKS